MPAPAPRPDPARLRRGPVLRYDNGKLAEGAYPAVFRQLRARLADTGVEHVVEQQELIRGASVDALRQRARRLAATGTVAVIVALADGGVSPATAMLTLALEAEGVPAVCLTADPDDALARAVSAHQAGGTLALVRLDLVADASDADRLPQPDRGGPARHPARLLHEPRQQQCLHAGLAPARPGAGPRPSAGRRRLGQGGAAGVFTPVPVMTRPRWPRVASQRSSRRRAPTVGCASRAAPATSRSWWPAAGGGHSAVIRRWSLSSEAVVEPGRRPDGVLAHGIAEFRAIR